MQAGQPAMAKGRPTVGLRIQNLRRLTSRVIVREKGLLSVDVST